MGSETENNDGQKQAELEKLKAETAFIKLQSGSYSRQNRLEAIKSLGTFITAIVALFGLFFTYNQQRSQLQQIENQHLDEDFTKDVQQFSSAATDASKVVSIAKLATYFQPQYEQYHSQLINLFVYYIEADSSQPVQSIIQRELVNNASNKTLAALIEQNRLMQQNIIDKTIFSKVGMVLLPDSSFVGIPKFVLKNFTWNINTIIQCINRIRKVADVNFSNVILSRTPMSYSCQGLMAAVFFAGQDKEEKELCPQLVSSQLADSLEFDSVTFSQSGLCGLSFTNCRFQDVNLDESILIGAQFSNCTFSGTSSARNFTWDAGVKVNAKFVSVNEDYPVWYQCKIRMAEFSPDPGIAGPLFIPKGLNFFDESTWQFDTIDSNAKRWFNLRNTN